VEPTTGQSQTCDTGIGPSGLCCCPLCGSAHCALFAQRKHRVADWVFVLRAFPKSFSDLSCPELGEGEWFQVAARSPVATLILAGLDADLPGQVIYCNIAAQRLFVDRSVPGTPCSTIFDLIEPQAREVLRELLPAADPVGPVELAVDVIGSASTEFPEVGHSSPPGRSVSLLIQALPSGDFVAQIVGRDGWQAMDRVLSEQHQFHSALMELSELAHTTQDDEDFYQLLIERAVQVVPGAQGGSVQLNVVGTTTFRFVAAVGYDLAGLQRHVLHQEHFFRDASDPQARIVRDFVNEGRTPEIAEWLETVGRLSEIVVNTSAPVMVNGRPVAFVSLDNFEDPKAMNATTVEMTTVLSRLIGDLWLRRQLEAEVRKEREAFRQQALCDPLTGVANRRSLDRALSETIAKHRSANRPTAVLFFDIDDFKGVNDRLGHNVGDEVLIRVTQELTKAVSGSDVVGRWGGDEFLLLPANIGSPEEAITLALKILERFETALKLSGDGTFRARVSVGVGWTDTSQVESIDLVRAADSALYEAKASGKGTARLSIC